ncbi:MAG: hypothetical protein J0L67_14710 [Cytophagales bacterium]|nr:hypothetical protein [Cytophagales bacterium]
MENKNDIVQFSIVKVVTEQFAIIEEAWQENAPINLNSNFRFAIDRNARLVAAFCQFKFEHNGIPFLKVEVSNHFQIAPASWKKFLRDNVTTLIPKGFMVHLGMITVGTARGVLHTKTEGTRFNEFILPTINVMDMIKDDVTFTEKIPAKGIR